MARRAAAVAVPLALGCLVAGLPALAQPRARVPTIGVLLFSTPTGDPNLAAFRQGLRDLGYVENQNVVLEYRYAEGRASRLPELAAELVRLRPDVIFALGGDVASVARAATTSIPIVVSSSADPVRAGLIASLARPGGNVTGVSFLLSELAGKRVEFLREAAPRVSRIGVLWNPDHVDDDFRETEAAGRALGIQIHSLEVRRAEDFDAALEGAGRQRLDALIVVSSRLTNLHQQRILDFAAAHRMPLVAGWGPWAARGALLTYGPNLDEVVRRAAVHVDKILKGARPGDLPVEQPTRFELVLNLKTAEALRLTVPQSLLLRADRVIR